MKRILALTTIILSVSITMAETIDDVFGRMDVATKMQAGQPLAQADAKIFGEEMTIRACEGGLIIIGMKDGRTQTISLQRKNPKQPPVGDIALYYRQQGEQKTFGRPIEGEHMLFGDTYRLHVFDKAIIVWRNSDKAVQSAIFEKRFK